MSTLPEHHCTLPNFAEIYEREIDPERVSRERQNGRATIARRRFRHIERINEERALMRELDFND